jgi:hypothetical protein
MGSTRLTLLELHGDIKIGPKSLGFGSEGESSAPESDSSERSRPESEAAEESGGPAGVALLVGLVFLGILGLAVRNRLGGDSGAALETPVELAESDDL